MHMCLMYMDMYLCTACVSACVLLGVGVLCNHTLRQMWEQGCDDSELVGGRGPRPLSVRLFVVLIPLLKLFLFLHFTLLWKITDDWSKTEILQQATADSIRSLSKPVVQWRLTNPSHNQYTIMLNKLTVCSLISKRHDHKQHCSVSAIDWTIIAHKLGSQLKRCTCFQKQRWLQAAEGTAANLLCSQTCMCSQVKPLLVRMPQREGLRMRVSETQRVDYRPATNRTFTLTSAACFSIKI